MNMIQALASQVTIKKRFVGEDIQILSLDKTQSLIGNVWVFFFST